MISLDPKIIEAVRKAAEQNRRAGAWVAPDPIPSLELSDEPAGPATGERDSSGG
jgi:hypothetical protein